MGVSHIFVPGVGETVNATSERHIYQVGSIKKNYYCKLQILFIFYKLHSGVIFCSVSYLDRPTRARKRRDLSASVYKHHFWNNSLQVKLKDALVTAAKFSRAKDAELAWIDAVIGIQMTEEKEQVIISLCESWDIKKIC